MWKPVAKKTAILAVSLFVASLAVFLVCAALPGDVARVILGEGAAPEAVAALRAEYGLDRPFLIQYLDWLGQVLSGSFGTSFFTQQPVSFLIAPRIEVTLSLVGLALALSILIAVPVGALAAVHRRNWRGFTASIGSQLGLAIPAFWLAILLVLVFAVWLGWLPANGYVRLGTDPLGWLAHLVLPVISLAIVQSAVLVRYFRSAVIEVLNQDYYRTARSIGWRPWPALLRHGLRNVALSLVTVIGLQLGSMLVGAIIIESVFALPGLGTLLLDAVATHDLMVVQGTVMFLVAVVLVINALVDLSYLLIDPRVRGSVG